MSINKITSTPEEMLNVIEQYYNDGYRLVTATCIDEGEVFRLVYSLDKDLTMVNLEVAAPREKFLPSISAIYTCAFLVENEIQELFGLKIENIALDLGGKLYMADGVKEAPMARELKPAVRGDE
ncbi:MAG: NADH-quinone oxidoreductase subunit C [Syntrophomonadaceae bacterium]|nr:NADH-quinone oxidoreductase subunit C [Syntrophomonadaceae bacterium]